MDVSSDSSVLVIAAHPDDIDFGAAGTVASWTAVGVAVSYLIVTDGEAGGQDRDLARSAMAAIRRDEQRLAASKVGVQDVQFLGYPDGRVVADLGLRRDIARAIRQSRPTRIMCPSPERDLHRLFVSHPDHLAVGEASLCAIYPDARNPFAFPELLEEGLEPHSVGEIWLMGSPNPGHQVDITAFIDNKLAALLCHQSQISDPASITERVRGFTADIARAAGLGENRFAETFSLIELPF